MIRLDRVPFEVALSSTFKRTHKNGSALLRAACPNEKKRSAGVGDRALRHHLDQIGAVGRRSMDIRQQPVSGNLDAVERAR